MTDLTIHYARQGDKLTPCGEPVKGLRTSFRMSGVTCRDCIRQLARFPDIWL